MVGGRNEALTIWLYREDDQWIAIIEEFGIIGVGDTKEEAVKELTGCFCAHLGFVVEEIEEHGIDKIAFIYPLKEKDIEEIKAKGGTIWEGVNDEKKI